MTGFWLFFTSIRQDKDTVNDATLHTHFISRLNSNGCKRKKVEYLETTHKCLTLSSTHAILNIASFTPQRAMEIHSTVSRNHRTTFVVIIFVCLRSLFCRGWNLFTVVFVIALPNWSLKVGNMRETHKNLKWMFWSKQIHLLYFLQLLPETR